MGKHEDDPDASSADIRHGDYSVTAVDAVSDDPPEELEETVNDETTE